MYWYSLQQTVLASGDKHTVSFALASGDKHTVSSALASGDKHTVSFALASGDKHTVSFALASGDKHTVSFVKILMMKNECECISKINIFSHILFIYLPTNGSGQTV